MANRYERKLQKIFTGNAQNDMTAKFGSMKTGTPVYSNDLDILQSTEYEQGWASSVLEDYAPFMEEMNGVQYGFSKQLAYLFQNGIPEWLETETYYIDQFCREGNLIYYSLIDNNVDNQPSLDNGTNWAVYKPSTDIIQNPFSILSGAVGSDGYANILYAPGSGTIDVTGTLSDFRNNNTGSRTITQTFGSPKTLVKFTATYFVYPSQSSSITVKAEAVLSDSSTIELGKLSRSVYSRLEQTISYNFSTPTVVTAIKFTYTQSGIGSGHITNINFTERKSNSTADTLYFNVGGSYPEIISTNVNGETFNMSYIEPVNVSEYSNGFYNIFIKPDGTAEVIKNNYYGQPNTPTPNEGDIWLDTCILPLKCSKYTSGSWVDFDGVYCGNITVNGGVITALNQPYFGVPKITKANGVVTRSLVYTYLDGANGLNIYNDGYCKQWGISTGSTWGIGTTNLLRTMSNNNYVLNITSQNTSTSDYTGTGNASLRGSSRAMYQQKNTNNFTHQNYETINWHIFGFLAQDQF